MFLKKILIFYGSYGGGHFSAAKSIRDYISDHYKDYDVVLIDCIEYINKLVNKLSTTAYNEMAKKAPWAWKKVYFSAEKGVLSKVSNASNSVMANKLGRLILKEKPDLIVSTHPFSSQMCAILKKRGKISTKVATVMTDFHVHNQWIVCSDFINYFFVSNSKLKEELIELGVDSFKIFVTGIPISPRFLDSFDKNLLIQEFGLKKNLFTILFFAGGAFGLGKERTFEIFKCLVHRFTNVQMVAISGKNKKMKELFENEVVSCNASDRVKVIEFTRQVPELMSISDLVITKPRWSYYF